MPQEIINRVANSKLMTIDLEDFYPKGNRVRIDLKDWLEEGLVLREKGFREAVNNYNWNQFKETYVSLHCSSEAIIPAWAYMLLATKLSPICKKVLVGSLETLESMLFQELLNDFDVVPYTNKPVIVKGCAHLPIPQNAYLLLIEKLQPVAKSLMYGEACSSVPLFKN
jgi:hypothetical protein